MPIETKPIRLPVGLVRRVKVAAALCEESMQEWLSKAAEARLEREGKLSAGDRRRVAAVEFEP